MSLPPFPHTFISIEGNIGAGKTTLSKMLAKDFDTRLILEQFTDNPFLPLFYDNPDRYAFPVELFFMTERYKQLQTDLSQQQLFQEKTVADYFFMKTLLFARNNLNEQEFRLFQQVFNILNDSFPKPDLLVYLHRPIPQLIKNIKKRARSFEADISIAYLESLQQAYFNFFKSPIQIPILIIDLDDCDFIESKKHYQSIIDLISIKYETGIHRVFLKNR
ncbi:MAG: deoxynucleoside kinase [Bacteroidota bacterium]